MENNNDTSNRRSKGSPNFWMGLIFILGGIIILLNQADLLPVQLNWWALFIMLPAVMTLKGAYNRFRANGNQPTPDVLVSGLVGIFMGGLSISLLLDAAWDFNWSLLWPLMLIVIGIGMLFGRSRRQ